MSRIGLGLGVGFGGARAWTPARLPSGVLVAWHHVRSAAQVGGISDGAAVASWAALAGGDALVQGTAGSRPVYRAPQYGGRARLVFDGSDDFLAGATARATITHLMVAGRIRWLNATRTAPSSAPFYPSAFADGYRGMAGLNTYDGSVNQVIFTGFTGSNIWFDAAAPTVYRRDGVTISTAAADVGMDRVRTRWTMGRTVAFGNAALEVGRDRNQVGATSAFNGDLCEVIALASPTGTQLTQAETYLSYWQKGSLVACVGDSLTAGYPVNNPQAWPAVFDEATGGALDVPNFAIGGQGLRVSTAGGIPTMLVDDPAKLSGLTTGRVKAVLVVWAGTNDLAQGDSAATVESSLWTYCDARRAEGWTVVVCTLIDRTDAGKGGTFDAKRATLNAGILANYASHATAVVDLAGNAHLGPNGVATTETTYFDGDKVHLKAAGYALVESLIRPVVLALLPA